MLYNIVLDLICKMYLDFLVILVNSVCDYLFFVLFFLFCFVSASSGQKGLFSAVCSIIGFCIHGFVCLGVGLCDLLCVFIGCCFCLYLNAGLFSRLL